MNDGRERSNPAFEDDVGVPIYRNGTRQMPSEEYRLPRLSVNRNNSNLSVIELNRNGVNKPYGNTGIQLDNIPQIPYQKGDSVSDSASNNDENEDYSLLSFFRNFSWYKSISKRYRNLNKKVDFRRLWNRIILFNILLLCVAYFVVYHNEFDFLNLSGSYDDIHYCHEHGFLLILSAIVFTLLIYFQILKPLFIKRIKKWHKAKKTSTSHSKTFKILDKWFVKLILYAIIIISVVLFLLYDAGDDHARRTSILGIFIIVAFGFLFSAAPRKIIWRHVIWGIGLQFAMGMLILRWSVGKAVFKCLADKVHTFLKFTDHGTEFVYGKLISEFGIFAFKILSVIIFFSFCIQILYYYGAMQWIVIKLGWLLQISIGTTACESVNAAANIFLGQTEAPLMIREFLPLMTKSELHAVMTGGFATIAGSVLAAYISFGVNPTHLLSASVMSAPAALGFAKLFYPETEVSKTNAKDIKITKSQESNVLHAACEGVVSVVSLVANITANLIAFIAFIAFIDAVLSWSCSLFNVGEDVCTLSNIFGYVFMPLAWVMGVPWEDCYYVGQLIGTKTIVNEFVAYSDLSKHVENKLISKRAELISIYALCGFSNITAIGIQIGGLGSMAPERRGDLAEVAFRAMIAGSAACFLTACVAGSLLTTEAIQPAFNSTSF